MVAVTLIRAEPVRWLLSFSTGCFKHRRNGDGCAPKSSDISNMHRWDVAETVWRRL